MLGSKNEKGNVTSLGRGFVTRGSHPSQSVRVKLDFRSLTLHIPVGAMPPRRKSKKAQADADGDGDNASTRSTPPPSAGLSLGTLVNEVDLSALSSFFPEASLETPSAPLIVQCYRLILNQAEQLEMKTAEVEGMQAEVEKKEVELDQALQDRENAVRDLETSVEDVTRKLEEATAEKEELSELDNVHF